MGAGLQTTLVGWFSLLFLAAAVPTASQAQPPGDDFISLVSDLTPIGEELLESSRGRAMAVGGIQIEVTGMLRLLSDGQNLLDYAGGNLALHGVAAQAIDLQTLGISSEDVLFEHPLFVNTMDGAALEQYREINMHFKNLPVGLSRIPVIPDLLLMRGTGHY
ncbi:hypothetical protein MK489_02850 [Myxococcota bacterium]|nr:hypothetical protein [Myxococcota bacterium]